MEIHILEGAFDDIQQQLHSLPLPPKQRVRMVITDSGTTEVRESPPQSWRPMQFRNGVPLLPLNENTPQITTEQVKLLIEELDDQEVLDARGITGC